MIYKTRGVEVKASEIAQFLGKELDGENIIVKKVCSLQNVGEHGVVFLKGDYELKNHKNVLVITTLENKGKFKPAIYTDNPRRDFVKIMAKFFVELVREGISKSAVIDKGAKTGKNVSIGHNSYIGPDVEIGDDTIIKRNVVVASKVKIGKNCVIKDNTILGSEGFGFEYDENGIPMHFPQIGEVVIGDNVWIGSNTTVERGTLDKTIIGSNILIEDVVQIGHNCFVDDNTFISGGVIICGSVIIGRNCWLAPNSVIREGIKIGNNGFVGLGAVVVKDVPENEIVVGNPAKKFEKK